MRVLVAHNRYRFDGGEDTVVSNEVGMLRAAGHEVMMLEADNRSIEGPWGIASAAASVFASRGSRKNTESLLRRFRPNVVHVHNWFPLLSPSVISAAAEGGVAVVHTLHNFRMMCASANLFRDGKICCDCVGRRFPIAPLRYGCYRGSRVASAAVVAGFSYQRLAHTWDCVSTFIALTEFQRELLIRGGIDPNRTVVKPHFVQCAGAAGEGQDGYALFVGRLVPEKGIRTVLEAWERNPMFPKLKVMGDGPLADEVRTCAMRLPHVQYLGQQPRSSVAEAMGAARFLVFASEAYETFALVIIESLAAGTPVVAAELPSIAELIQDGETGWLFTPGDVEDLTAKVMQMAAESSTYQGMRRRCRTAYERRYTEAINYQMLMDIYRRASAGTRPWMVREEEMHIDASEVTE